MSFQIGKHIGDNVYIHVCALNELPEESRSAIHKAVALTKLNAEKDFNAVKLSRDLSAVSLLDYEGFFSDAFPQLRQCWTVDLQDFGIRYRSYADSFNPPILHRKELLLPEHHPKREVYSALTASAEQIGLFDDPVRIGFRRSWDRLLAERGYKVAGNELVPIGNDDSTSTALNRDWSGAIDRHLTALIRYNFSAPIQCLGRHGFLDGTRSIFDYGCGRGDDIRGLRESNLHVSGWDPYYSPSEPKAEADIVNLGFVINVIENLSERTEALRCAFALAKQLVVVSVMIRSDASVDGLAYGDGVVTSRNTFQKYYTQAELRHYVEEVLGEVPIPIAPGIVYVFKDKFAEQRFQYGRLASRRNVLRLEARARAPRPSAADRATVVYEQNREALDALRDAWVSLGRAPEADEFPPIEEISSNLGSPLAAFRLLSTVRADTAELVEQTRQSRINDLRVYMARLCFERVRRYRSLESRLQRDVRAFFGGFKAAQEAGHQLLRSLSDIPRIDEECRRAADTGLGWYTEGDSLQLHLSVVERLPVLLRAYVECGAVLYGDLSVFDLIKIHVRSSKLTLMRFDDFAVQPIPKLRERIKINLRTQGVDVFAYGKSHEPTYLYQKSRFINEEFPNYAEQLSFEESLDAIGLLRFPGHGPPASAFDDALERHRFRIDGFCLKRSSLIPPLSNPCGRFLTYGQLIECGETWNRLQIDNTPREADTYSALADLAFHVLDPVIDYFGMIRLTYGFCSTPLARAISGRIAPALDQHAGHERKRNGDLICHRGGASCDFIVDDEDMEEVARWIVRHTRFDRLYLYGRDRPLHVSYGPEHSREVVELKVGPAGRLIPRVRRDLCPTAR